MAHPDDCHTCDTLASSDAVVTVHETDDPNTRRFEAHPWPVTEALAFSTATDAQAHPLARALWRNGTTAVHLDPSGALVCRTDPRAWPFYAEGMATSLREQLALSG